MHTVTAQVTDSGGLSDSDSMSITINAVESSITITNPADNSVISGKITVSTVVFGLIDPVVSFYLDGQLLDEDSSAPYEISIHTKNLTVGTHQLMASVNSAGLNDAITIEKESKGGSKDNGSNTCKPNQKKPGC